MALMDWTQSLSVEVKRFDDEHKVLIGLINELHSAMTKGQGSKILGSVLKNLIDYTVNHFNSEEEAMKEHRYPGLGLHAIEHKNLTVKVIELQNRFEKGE